MKTNTIVGLGIGWITTAILGIIGWVANLIQLIMGVMAWDAEITNGQIAMLVLKCVGVFAAPLGSILGIVGFFT